MSAYTVKLSDAGKMRAYQSSLGDNCLVRGVYTTRNAKSKHLSPPSLLLACSVTCPHPCHVALSSHTAHGNIDFTLGMLDWSWEHKPS